MSVIDDHDERVQLKVLTSFSMDKFDDLTRQSEYLST